MLSGVRVIPLVELIGGIGSQSVEFRKRRMEDRNGVVHTRRMEDRNGAVHTCPGGSVSSRFECPWQRQGSRLQRNTSMCGEAKLDYLNPGHVT